MPYTDHIEQAKDPVTCAVLTISDTRTEADDKSGKIIKELVEAAGHSIAFYRVVKDEAARSSNKSPKKANATSSSPMAAPALPRATPPMKPSQASSKNASTDLAKYFAFSPGKTSARAPCSRAP